MLEYFQGPFTLLLIKKKIKKYRLCGDEMFRLFNKMLNYPIYFRNLFLIIFGSSVLVHFINLDNHSNYYILYVFCSFLLGIGFYNMSIWVTISLVTVVVLSRYFLIPVYSPGIITFLTFYITYLLIALIATALMKRVHKIKEDNIELTIALSKALDSRDAYTLHHSEKVTNYSLAIAKKMGLSKDLLEVIQVGGLLHDIGKIGIPEHILNKPGKLEESEYNIVKSHPVIGYEMIKHVDGFQKNGILDIVLYHHERYDGKGYPEGLKGEQIPLVARIVAVADSFDAMSSNRVYREGINIGKILAEMRWNKGKQFDPEIVDAFLSIIESRELGSRLQFSNRSISCHLKNKEKKMG